MELLWLVHMAIFELDIFKPLIAHNILQSIDIMADSAKTFAQFCVRGIKA